MNSYQRQQDRLKTVNSKMAGYVGLTDSEANKINELLMTIESDIEYDNSIDDNEYMCDDTSDDTDPDNPGISPEEIFFHLIDLLLINAHAMYKAKTGKHISLADFQLELTRQLIDKYLQEEKNVKIGRPSAKAAPMRLISRHFPQLVPAVPGGKKNSQRMCVVCKHTEIGTKHRRDSRYQCVQCDVGLCITPCFEIYHSQETF